MASKHPDTVRMWFYGQAPREFQRLFAGSQESDWIAHVPESQRASVEASILQWRPIYPVQSLELKDGSVLYRGSPKAALESVAAHGKPVSAPVAAAAERRSATRVQFECPSRYRTSEHAGYGHTIDISSTGIAFTTQTSLAGNSEVTLHVTWPVRLEGGLPVELSAEGKLARAQPAMAAIHLDRISFSIAG